jgi:hypothetical protein
VHLVAGKVVVLLGLFFVFLVDFSLDINELVAPLLAPTLTRGLALQFVSIAIALAKSAFSYLHIVILILLVILLIVFFILLFAALLIFLALFLGLLIHRRASWALWRIIAVVGVRLRSWGALVVRVSLGLRVEILLIRFIAVVPIGKVCGRHGCGWYVVFVPMRTREEVWICAAARCRRE